MRHTCEILYVNLLLNFQPDIIKFIILNLFHGLKLSLICYAACLHSPQSIFGYANFLGRQILKLGFLGIPLLDPPPPICH